MIEQEINLWAYLTCWALIYGSNYKRAYAYESLIIDSNCLTVILYEVFWLIDLSLTLSSL